MYVIVAHFYAPGCDFMTVYLPLRGLGEVRARHYAGHKPYTVTRTSGVMGPPSPPDESSDGLGGHAYAVWSPRK
jgi:hypothetical protein